MNHGNQLERKLKELGVKKGELAKMLGVHPNTITLWLSKSILNVSVRQKIAQSLDLAESSIFNESQDVALAAKEMEYVYGKKSTELTKKLKKLDAFKYCGLLSSKEDGLQLQKKWREEW